MATHGWHGATIYGDDGWEIDGAVWNEQHGADVGEPTLATFLASAAAIPIEEAEQISDQVLREWKDRQATIDVARERRGTTIGVRVFTAVVAFALVGVILGVAVLVWLLVSLF